MCVLCVCLPLMDVVSACVFIGVHMCDCMDASGGHQIPRSFSLLRLFSLTL